jgi:hypothetical protein
MGRMARKFERDLSRAWTRNAAELPISRADPPVKDRFGIQLYRVLVRIVTNSSAAVGWMPIVVSNCVLVAPQLIATAKP